MSLLAAGSGVTSITGYGTDWLYFFATFAPLALLVGAGLRRGTGRNPLLRFADGLGRITGLPAWAAAGFGVGMSALVVAVLGFFWDVAWHVDLGRDSAVLFTPGHSGILFGLGLLPIAAAVSITVATATQADVALKWGRWRAPWSAVALGVLGTGALAGFPLDELWHRSYGVDVSMWGPTHLLMIGGASFAPVALLLMLREGGPGSKPRLTKRLSAGACSAVLLGASTFQLEFDMGMSQWQQLYHPVLIALASGFALVVARRVIGPGGALYVTVEFYVVRLFFFWLMGSALHHRAAHFAMYLGSALVVEVAALLTRYKKPLTQALVIGFGIGTVGLASEWGWSHLFGFEPWMGTLAGPRILVAVAAAVAAAVLGTATGRIASGRQAALPGAALALAALVVVASIVIPNPRRGSDATVTLRTTPASAGRVNLLVEVQPADTFEGADRLDAFSWQGGHAEVHPLRRVSDGVYVSPDPVPVGGTWKTLVRFAEGPVLAGAAVFMPADPEIKASEIPVVAERTVPLERDTKLLLREAHDGPTWPAVVAYSAIGLVALAWFSSLAAAYAATSRRSRSPLAAKRVVITGALGGIGQAVAQGLREQGARVVGLDLVDGPDVVACDVTDADRTRAAMTEAATRLGGIDVLINLAGIGRAQDTGDFPDADARRTVEVNFWGTWNASAAAVPWLVESGGHAVITASGLAIATVPWSAAYSASKRAVTAYADTLRVEYGHRLTVTTVNPGYIRTPIHEVAAASGASLEGVVPADPMSSVVVAYLRACIERPRHIATSLRSTVMFALARQFPIGADRFTHRAQARVDRPDPTFVMTADELDNRRSTRVKARR